MKKNILIFFLSITIPLVTCSTSNNNNRLKESLGLIKDNLGESKTTYDQRQTGKYNVHFNIKDVQLFSIRGDEFNAGVGDGIDYDYGEYDYDPGHFTINPILAMLGADKPFTTTTTTTEKPDTYDGLMANETISKISNESSVVEITSKPIVTISTTTTEKNNEAKLEITSKKPDVVDELTTEYEKFPVESILSPILRQLLGGGSSKTNKAPFRLKAVYKRPHKYRISPRRVTNEIIIEGVPNRVDDAIEQDSINLGVGLPNRPQNLPNLNLPSNDESTTSQFLKPRKTRKPNRCFEGEYLDDEGKCRRLRGDHSEL